MRRNSTRMITAAIVFGGLALAATAGRIWAHAGGVNGRTQTGCSCHSSTPNQNGAVVVDILGPTAILPSATGHYTLTVSGGPSGTAGGFDLAASAGTLVPGTGTHLMTGELAQSDNTRRTWSFDWQAPATEGSASFVTVGMASNGSGSGGDSWNYFGDATGTPFAITVSEAVAVDFPSPIGFSLDAPSPNPSAGAVRESFFLPRDADVRLEILDVRGRTVATVLSGALPAGRHTALWDGRALLGASARAGMYWIRLSAGGSIMTRRWALLR